MYFYKLSNCSCKCIIASSVAVLLFVIVEDKSRILVLITSIELLTSIISSLTLFILLFMFVLLSFTVLPNDTTLF